MTELLNSTDCTLTEDDSLVLKFFEDKDRFDLRTCRDRPHNSGIWEIAKHNTVLLDEYGSFEDMLNVVINFERYLKHLYPNGYFQSYFIMKDNQKPALSFHHYSPNGDWIRNKEILELIYPVRKNTF